MPAHLRAHIERAYTIIGNHTPLPVDCGQLCDDACCKGEEGMGMLLFPGEAVMLRDVPNFHMSRIKYMDGRAWHVTCDPPCRRTQRPLACRIFPLIPHVEGDRVTALPDPRAGMMCPLASGEFLHPPFRRAVQRAFTHLAQEPKILDFMRMLSEDVDELRRLLP